MSHSSSVIMTFEDTQINQSLLLELTLAKVDQEVTKVDLLILKQIQAGSDDIKCTMDVAHATMNETCSCSPECVESKYKVAYISWLPHNRNINQ